MELNLGGMEDLSSYVLPGAAVASCFSENSDKASEIPPWAAFMLAAGWEWAEPGAARNVGVITLPCESAASGLITLGAMCRRLRTAGANDLDAHFQRISELAAGREGGAVFRMDGRRGRFVPDGELEPGLIWLKELDSKRKTRVTVTRSSAAVWHAEGEAPVQVKEGTMLPGSEICGSLFPEAPPALQANLKYSDSAVCLAGRAGGQEKTRRILNAVRFYASGSEMSLDRLLSVQDWSPATISRVSYFNTLTEKLDRQVVPVKLVIADGAEAFLKVMGRPEFINSDVLAVIPRTLDRDRLESVALKLADLMQWYQPAAESRLPSAVPAGMTCSVIRKIVP